MKWLLVLLLLPGSLAAQDTVFTRTIVPRPKPPTVICAPDSLQRARLDSLMRAVRNAGSDRTTRRVTAAAAVIAAVGVLILVFRKQDDKTMRWHKDDDHEDKR